MELLACFLLAMIFTGGRSASDIIHAAKGTTPPRIEKARLKQQANPGTKAPSPFAAYWRAVWDDAWSDAKSHHERVRQEKAEGTRPKLGQRTKRLGHLLWQPIGNSPAPAASAARPAPDTEPARPAPGPAPAPVVQSTWDGREPLPGPAGRRDGNGDLVFSDDPTDPNGVRDCLVCAGAGALDGRPCPACRQRQAARTADHDARTATPTAVAPPAKGQPPMTEPHVPAETFTESDLKRAQDLHGRVPENEDAHRGPIETVLPTGVPNPHCAGCGSEIERFRRDRTPGAGIEGLCPTCGWLSPDRPADQKIGDAIIPPTAPAGSTEASGGSYNAPGGTTMTQSTGEAVNYETTVAELNAIIEKQRGHLDHTAAALKAIEDAKAAINAAQQSYRPAAEAAGSVHQHLSAMSLDAETLGHTGTVADAMPPNVVDQMFDELEGMHAAAAEQHRNAEVALASSEAALKTVQEKYGDAHTTVAGELGGNAAFLDSAGSPGARVAA